MIVVWDRIIKKTGELELLHAIVSFVYIIHQIKLKERINIDVLHERS